MIDPAPSNSPAIRSRVRGFVPPMAVLAAAVAVAALGSSVSWQGLPALPVSAVPEQQAALAAPPAAEAMTEAPAAEADAPGSPLDPWRGTLGGPLSRWAWTPGSPALPAEEPTAPRQDAESGEPPAGEPPRTVMTVPLPVPRPPELRRPSDLARRAERLARRQPAAAPMPPPEDNRSFLEKLFGVENPPARSYAALESKPADLAPRPRLSPPLAAPSTAEGGAAVYNIAARTVTLPSGERLEAHSGLGEIMDDPRYVNVRMRGATPPGTYALTEREALFHGVRAIRLTPVGGPEAVYGRVGLLAHTYMLGPNGASNGCISFRDYERFLQAFLRGEIQRVVVVTGTQDPLPSLAERNASPVRMARN